LEPDTNQNKWPVEIHIYISKLFIFAHVGISIGLSIRVIMKRRPAGISLAWLVLILILPFAGALLYLLVGERRLGKKRVERATALLEPYMNRLRKLPPESRINRAKLSPKALPLNRLAEATIGVPATAGNKLLLLSESETILKSIIADIDRAKHCCHLEFYKWTEGGLADEVGEALIGAAQRGVICRVLLDAVGSAKFMKSGWPGRFQDSGIELVAALPVAPLRMAFARLDLRLHRKIVVIDGTRAYTGSVNLADPRFFKQQAGIGQWIDAMVRIKGPAVQALEALFFWDWEVETGRDLQALKITGYLEAQPHGETANVQVIPSGPGYRSEAIHQLVLTAIYGASRELIITTPYFVPDQSLLIALLAAAQRGVALTVILPQKIDSWLVNYAGRSYFDDLLRAGVRILGFQEGLLHTKSITVDGEIALFGTVNLDMRSFWLDFEVTLCIYDTEFATLLRKLQQRYAEKSIPIDPEVWRQRSGWKRFIENLAQLFGPLL
jgi:cardiolipin synthase